MTVETEDFAHEGQFDDRTNFFVERNAFITDDQRIMNGISHINGHFTKGGWVVIFVHGFAGARALSVTQQIAPRGDSAIET